MDDRAFIKNKLLLEFPSVHKIYLFGSWGSEFEKKDSDIDIAILPKNPIDTVELWKVAQKLASELRIDIDLVDLLKASTVMRFKIIQEGKTLYSDTSYTILEFESRVFSDYVRLNEERALILQAIAKTGRIHA